MTNPNDCALRRNGQAIVKPKPLAGTEMTKTPIQVTNAIDTIIEALPVRTATKMAREQANAVAMTKLAPSSAVTCLPKLIGRDTAFSSAFMQLT